MSHVKLAGAGPLPGVPKDGGSFTTPLPVCRMDPFQDAVRRLREAFSSGRTRPAAFRAAQLEGLSRFLRENKQQLLDALAQDLRKVVGAGAGAGGRAHRLGVEAAGTKETGSGLSSRKGS